MKVKKAVYYHTYFEDFKNQERPVTICALSIIDEDATYGKGEYYDNSPKILSLGIAIGHIQDKKLWSREMGEKIAYNKAINWWTNDNILVSSKAGYISTELVDALLAREAEHIQLDPGNYIKGYNEAKKKYLSKDNTINIKELKDKISKLDTIPTEVIKACQKTGLL